MTPGFLPSITTFSHLLVMAQYLLVVRLPQNHVLCDYSSSVCNLQNIDVEYQLRSLLEKYSHQEKIKHKSLKCLFTGPPRVGKTTLKKRLLKTIKNLTSNAVSVSAGLEKPVTVVLNW